jgi:mono/diheme cytochrome c family protein
MDYPIWDPGIGPPLLMAIVAVTHVIVSHFAIGGGLVLAVSETLAVRRGDDALRALVRRSSLVLILVSTVFGAISGVGIWVVAGLVSPATIAALIRNYVWGWAIEWVFFLVEIVAALVYFATWDKISKRAHLLVIWIYFVSAYMSLVVINGIITFMLTPGDWLASRAFWDGFFNPTYWPALLLRTGITILMGIAFMVLPALKAAPGERPRLMRFLGWWMAGGVAISYAGYRWWEAALPDSVRALFLGGDTLAALADTRGFLLWALAATLALTVVFLLAWPRAMRWVPALLLMVAAFAFFGGYERLREGSRKPYLIHDYMFSNGVLIEELPRLREEGVLSKARWAAFSAELEEAPPGRGVFLAQCAVCHTLDGYQALRPLLPEDADMTYSLVYALFDQAEPYLELEPGETVDKSELDYPFMPPFAGTEEEMEQLVEYLASLVEPPAQEARLR